MGESSKFQKSWTFEIQILKIAVYLQSVNNFKFKWSIAQSWTENKSEAIKTCLIQHFEARKSQNPEFRNNHENFHPCNFKGKSEAPAFKSLYTL